MYAILQSGPLPDPHQCWIHVLYPRVSVGIQVSMRKYHFLPKFNFEFRGKISFGNPTIACSIFCRVLTIDYRGFADSSPIGRGGHTLYTTLTILYFRSTRTSCTTLSLFIIHYAHFWWNTPFIPPKVPKQGNCRGSLQKPQAEIEWQLYKMERKNFAVRFLCQSCSSKVSMTQVLKNFTVPLTKLTLGQSIFFMYKV